MSVGHKWFGMKSKRRQGKANASRRSFRSARIETLEPRQVLSVPTLAPIADVTLYSGSPLHIPLDGFASDGLDISFGVTSSNPSVEVSIPSDSTLGDSIPGTNRSMKIETNYGDMVLELFEDRVPRATERIITLAEDGFYDGIIFHRVIDDFMIQGGDPTGTGGGGSDLPDFDDQFHIDLQHNRGGLLSMAKSSEDTNNSQFFITEVPTRYLDFNHSIFGLLIEGESVREAISEVDTNASDKPDVDVVMESVEIYYDNQNATLMLKAPEGMTGETDITITIIHDGVQYVQPSFHVTVAADPENTQPFLQDVPPVVTSVDTEVFFQLTAIDVDGEPTITPTEGDPFVVPTKFLNEYGVYYLYQNNQFGYREVRLLANPDLDYSVNFDSGAVTVTPSEGLVGVHPILVATAAWETEEGKFLGIDTQLVPIVIQPDSLDAVSELEMSIVQTPTNTDEFGEVDQLPNNVDWMDEWESFSVEIWASTKTSTGPIDDFGIHTAAFDLTYNTDYYTATKIEYGNVFSQNRTGTIDDASGRVNNIGGSTPMFAITETYGSFSKDPENLEKFGDDKPVLVARVHFQPNATGAGVPINGPDGYMMPVTDLGLSIQNAQVGWNVAETTTVLVADAPEVDVWPMMYDCNDDGKVALGDLAFFASAYQTSVDPDDPNDPGRRMDYDRSGTVSLGDLAFFASNYQNTSSGSKATSYPAGFPDEWIPPAAPATSQTMATLEDEPSESLTDPDLSGANLSGAVIDGAGLFGTVADGTVANDTVTETQLAYAIAQSQKDSQSNTRSTGTASAIIDLLMQSEEF